MGFLVWLVVFSAVWIGVARLLRRPDDRAREVAKRAFGGARSVGNTFLGSAGGQSLPEVEPGPDDGLEPGGQNVIQVSPPEDEPPR
ncbi:MAG: hypothetical protein RIT28_975 [Pseudomonadota bacterium]